MSNNQTEVIPQYEDDEITLKELVLKIREYAQEVMKNWMIVILITIPILSYFLYQAFTTPKTYKANLTFMLNEDTGGGFSAVSGILGSLGFGGGGGGKYSLDKILELSKSRQIVEKVLFTKANFNGTEDYFANHIIREYKLLEKGWAKDTILNHFTFTKADVSKFDKRENKALVSIYGMMVSAPKNALFSSGFDKNSGIMTFGINSTSEDLSIELVKAFYNKLSEFYILKAVEKEQETYNMLRNKVDSLKYMLYGKEAGLAKFEDSNLFLQEQTVQLPKKRLNRDVQMLTLMYGEAVKNLEVAEFALNNKRPFLQSIDLPIAPIKPENISKLKNGVLGLFIGVLVASIFIILRKIIREAMA